MVETPKKSFEKNKIKIFLVEDQVSPKVIDDILREIFGSKNYCLDHARSTFSAILKIKYYFHHKYIHDLYFFDVRLIEKEMDEENFAYSFTEIIKPEFKEFFGENFNDFNNYKNIQVSNVEVYREFKAEFNPPENDEGFYIWAFLMSETKEKLISIVYSANISKIESLEWLNKSNILNIMQKSLFSKIEPDRYSNFLYSVKKDSEIVIVLLDDENRIEKEISFDSLPKKEKDFFARLGTKFDFDDMNFSYKFDREEENKGDKLRISISKKSGNNLGEYKEILKILEACSKNIIRDPAQYIDWDSISEKDIDCIKNEDDLIGFMEEKPLGILNNKAWTLRTILPGECYKILKGNDSLDKMKEALIELVKQHAWTDYAEIFSMVFNNGAIGYRVHESDETFAKQEIDWDITSKRFIDPIKKPDTLKLKDYESFDAIWRKQIEYLNTYFSKLKDKTFKNNKNAHEKKFIDIVNHFKPVLKRRNKGSIDPTYKEKSGDPIRKEYVQYTREDILKKGEIRNDRIRTFHIKNTGIKIGSISEGFKLFFPGSYFLDFIKELGLLVKICG